jgi:hypothetical protein
VFGISRRATVPGLYLCGFLTPPVAGALLRAALVTNCFLGAFPPVDLRAVCFVRAIALYSLKLPEISPWNRPRLQNWSSFPELSRHGPPGSQWSLLGRSFRRHQLVCYSCQESHHHAQRHPASTKNPRRTCLNCELLFTFTLTALFRATHIFQKESRLLLHKSTLTHIFLEFTLGVPIYMCWPLRASWMSLGMMVTLLAWIAHKLVSSKRPTK